MNRIAQLDPAVVVGTSKELFALVQTKLGVVPNLIHVPANSPAALEGYLNLDSESGFRPVRSAQLTDAEIIETAVYVGSNILTNCVNLLARTVADFPLVASIAGEIANHF